MGNAAIAIQLILGLLDRATQISALISQAQKEGRDVTSAELDSIVQTDNEAREALRVAIEKAARG